MGEPVIAYRTRFPSAQLTALVGAIFCSRVRCDIFLPCCRESGGAAQEETGVRPGAEAPFECPLTGGPLNGRGRTLLHKSTGLVFTESGINKAPGVARELIHEAARKLLDDSAAAAGGKKGKKKGTALVAQARLEDIVSRGGKWEQSELLVLNPEGDDAEAAKGRLHAMLTKVPTRVPRPHRSCSVRSRCAWYTIPYIEQ